MTFVTHCLCGAVEIRISGEFREGAFEAIQNWMQMTVRAGAAIACGCPHAVTETHESEGQRPAGQPVA